MRSVFAEMVQDRNVHELAEELAPGTTFAQTQAAMRLMRSRDRVARNQLSEIVELMVPEIQRALAPQPLAPLVQPSAGTN